jgi:hypothetical protein
MIGERIRMIVWMLAIALSVAGLVLSAAARPGNVQMAYTHLMITAGMSVLFALLAVRKLIALRDAKASRSAIAAEGARSMGLVWSWAALVIVATYATGVMNWKEWQAHFMGFFAVGGVCLALATILDNSAAKSSEDEVMLTAVHYLAIGHLVAMVLVILGFLIDGQMTRFLVERFTDWPAKNVMFFGAVGIAAISGAILKYLPRTA